MDFCLNPTGGLTLLLMSTVASKRGDQGENDDIKQLRMSGSDGDQRLTRPAAHAGWPNRQFKTNKQTMKARKMNMRALVAQESDSCCCCCCGCGGDENERQASPQRACVSVKAPQTDDCLRRKPQTSTPDEDFRRMPHQPSARWRRHRHRHQHHHRRRRRCHRD